MLIEFQCRCGHEFRTKPENAGRSIVCPNCLAQNVVPDASATCVELPSIEDARSLAPIVRRQQETARPNRADSNAASPQPDQAEKNRRSPPVPKESSHSKPTKSTSTRSKQHDAEAHSPSDNFEQLDEWTSPRRRRRKAEREDGDHSGKREKNRSKKANEGGLSIPIAIGLTSVLIAVYIGMMIAMVPGMVAAANHRAKIKTPQEFEKYANDDFQFRCDVPKGWEVEGRGGSGNIPPSVRIEKGSIKIVYRSSPSGAAIQDMSQAQVDMAGGDVPDELQPVSRVHDFQKDKFSNDLSNYKEIGEAEKVVTGWGEGRLSTFTASSGLNGSIYGYRVTLLTSQYQWNVVCQCSTKREFLAYQPIFRHIINSTGR